MKVDRQRRLLKELREFLQELSDHSDSLDKPRSDTAQGHYEKASKLINAINREEKRGER